MRIRHLITAGFLAVVLALTGCGAMPTSGEVVAGAAAEDQTPQQYDTVPEEPAIGADPQRVVEAFISAATSPAGDYRIARLFLSGEAVTGWQPGESVQVDQVARRQYSVQNVDDDTAKVTVAASPLAVVSDNGTYTEYSGEAVDLTYTLTRRGDGEWRISSAPNGVLMEELWFQQIYQAYPVMFFDPTQHFLVPEQRWFPRLLAVNRIVGALIAGPSAEMRSSLSTAFPDGTTVQEGSVKVDPSTGVASISFAQSLDYDERTLARMHKQALESLRASRATSLDMWVRNTQLTAPDLTVTSTAVDAHTVVVREDGFGNLSGAEVAPFAGFRAVADAQPTAVVWLAAREVAVIRTKGGAVQRVARDADPVTVDDRPGLIDPTVDPSGYVWSVPSDTPGQMRVSTTEGSEIPLESGLRDMSHVTAMQMSRDGTRLAVIGTADRTRPVLAFYPVLRGNDGRPTGLGTPVGVTTLSGKGVDLTWLDDLTVGVLVSGDESSFLAVTLGGTTERLAVRDGAVSIAGGNSPGNVRLLTDAGDLYQRRGTAWQRLVDGVQVLGTQQVSY